MVSSIWARFSGGKFASASGGIGLPATRVFLVIFHAPDLALKAVASACKGVPTVIATAIVTSVFANMSSPSKMNENRALSSSRPGPASTDPGSRTFENRQYSRRCRTEKCDGPTPVYLIEELPRAKHRLDLPHLS